MQIINCHGSVGLLPDSHSEGPGFDSQPWQFIICILSSVSAGPWTGTCPFGATNPLDFIKKIQTRVTKGKVTPDQKNKGSK